MTKDFVMNGIRYSLITAPSGMVRGEPDIKPDKTLWSHSSKRRSGIEGRTRWQNSHGSGTTKEDLNDV